MKKVIVIVLAVTAFFVLCSIPQILFGSPVEDIEEAKPSPQPLLIEIDESNSISIQETAAGRIATIDYDGNMRDFEVISIIAMSTFDKGIFLYEGKSGDENVKIRFTGGNFDFDETDIPREWIDTVNREDRMDLVIKYRDKINIISNAMGKGDYITDEHVAALTDPYYDVEKSVTVEDIYREYNANELRAEEIFEGNRYFITARFEGMKTDGLRNLTGGALLTMYKKIDGTRVYFLAEFEKEQEEILKEINTGDTITFVGKCIGNCSFVECELVR